MNADWKTLLQNSLSEEEKEKLLNTQEEQEPVSLFKKQHFRIEMDKRQKGKKATLISGFEGSENELAELAKTLKIKCGSGGSFRDGEILVQGYFRKKISEILLEMGRKTRVIQ